MESLRARIKQLKSQLGGTIEYGSGSYLGDVTYFSGKLN